MARIKLTAGRLRDFACPPARAQSFLWDTEAKGLAVRATPPSKTNPTGAKAFIYQGHLDGRDIRITIGDIATWGIDDAQAKARQLGTLIDQGIDPRAAKAEKIAVTRAQAKLDAVAGTTLADALREYVDKKRRAKDGLALKQRTKDDYLAMVGEGRIKADGTQCANGELFPLAAIPVASITADDIRSVHTAAMKRGDRRAAYAMQVLRAVLNWYGVKIADNPLGKDIAGRDRIAIPQARASGAPIPAENIGAWWRALDQAANPVSRDYFRFLVLTGARVSEPKNLTVGDCDIVAGRVTLRDTKNRRDHVILLSKQAKEIVERNIDGKKAEAALFEIADAKKTRATITKRSGVAWRAKDLRSTFVSLAEELVTAYTLKAMVNHTNPGDVTGTNYVRKGESTLRAGWQAVADFIEAKAVEYDRPTGIKKSPTGRPRKTRNVSVT